MSASLTASEKSALLEILAKPAQKKFKTVEQLLDANDKLIAQVKAQHLAAKANGEAGQSHDAVDAETTKRIRDLNANLVKVVATYESLSSQ